jgi:hypothetical protein
MNQIQDYKSKVSDGSSKVKFDLWTLVLAAVRLAGRYGLPVVAVLMAVAYVSACFKAFSIATIAIALMLPITILIALYIAVSEEVDA